MTLGTMVPCAATNLQCILPLSVAFNSVGKRQLIWDGRHANDHLPKVPFCMETLQREGWALFGGAGLGGTADIYCLPSYPYAQGFHSLSWIRVGGTALLLCSTAFLAVHGPVGLPTVMGNCVRFLRMKGLWLMVFLDELIFAHASTRGVISMAQLMLHTLPLFGWLIHPTKCQGVAVAIQRFIALG